MSLTVTGLTYGGALGRARIFRRFVDVVALFAPLALYGFDLP